MTSPFQDFQRAFGHHLRDPHHVVRPAGVPARAGKIYQDLVFNNLRSFLDRCFPVTRERLGEARWLRLMRCFFRDYALQTPWFREIPSEFVLYLSGAATERIPRWLPALAHYEWAELAVDIMETPEFTGNHSGNLMRDPIVLNPALLNLAYEWPVHRIGPDFRPRKPVATHLLVYRNSQDDVCFSEINPLTAHLIGEMMAAPASGGVLLEQLAATLPPSASARLFEAGVVLLEDLRRQGVVLGTQS